MRKLMMDHLWLQMLAEGAGDGAASGDNGQGAAGEGDQSAAAAEDLEAEFDKLVKGDGKFREIYGRRTQSVVQQRLKGSKAAVDRLNAMAPALEVLAARYDMDVDDPQLIERISKDASLLENKAMKSGNSTDMELELTKARAGEQRAMRMMRQVLAKQDYDKWAKEAEGLKTRYPGFDLDKQLENPKFRELISKYNTTLEGAYLALNYNDVIPATVEQAKQQAAASVASGQKRPRENGSGSQAVGTASINPATMARADYKKYEQAILRGERVSFG